MYFVVERELRLHVQSNECDAISQFPYNSSDTFSGNAHIGADDDGEWTGRCFATDDRFGCVPVAPGRWQWRFVFICVVCMNYLIFSRVQFTPSANAIQMTNSRRSANVILLSCIS